jgi:hypothetical protein
MGGIIGNERHLLSGLDIMAVGSFWRDSVVAGNVDPVLASVPEPASWILLLTGLVGLAFTIPTRIKK